MNLPWQVINELELTASKLAKEAIVEREARADNHELFEGLRLAYDSMITFGLKQIPAKLNADGAGLSWDSFTLAITGLISRNVTGHAARDLVGRLMNAATPEQWNGWYRRILIKDMRAGFGEVTVNRVCKKIRPEFVIPVFECQLAHDGANHESKITGSKLIEVKLDGVRVITVVYPEGRVDQFSRNGKELANFPHIRQQMSQFASQLAEPYVFDGEVMSHSFQDLMKQVHRKDNINASDAVLYLFDCLSLAEFQQGVSNQAQEFRIDFLRTAVAETENVKILGQELVDLDSAEGLARFREINASAIANGYEGIMIKDPSANYECKRSVSWLKQKPFIEVSLAIVDVEAGTGKNLGRLGALVCEGVDDGKHIRVNVGSGFSDSDRIDFWSNRVHIMGQIVEVRADAVTQNQDGTYSLRFPRFLQFRGFEVGEKI